MKTRLFATFGRAFTLRTYLPEGCWGTTGDLPPGLYELELADPGPEQDEGRPWYMLRGTRIGYRADDPPAGLLELEILTDEQVRGRLARLWAIGASLRPEGMSNAQYRLSLLGQAVSAAEFAVYMRSDENSETDAMFQAARLASIEAFARAGRSEAAMRLVTRYGYEGGTPAEVIGDWHLAAWRTIVPVGRRLIIGYEALVHALLTESAEALRDLEVALFIPLHPESWVMHPEEYVASGHPLYTLVADPSLRGEVQRSIRQALGKATAERRVVWGHPKRGTDARDVTSFLFGRAFIGEPNGPGEVLVSDVAFWDALKDVMGKWWTGRVRATVV